MKAVQIFRHGGVDVLEYGDIAEPAVSPTGLLIRVRACALNHLDLFIRQGMPSETFSFPHVLGTDIAGDVVEVGSLCQRIKVGQRVLLAPGLSCRQCPKCFGGKDNECRKYTVYGEGVPGGYQEYMVAEEYSAVPIPDDLDYEEAAAVPTAFLSAWHMLFSKAGLQPGEEVFVLSASSGIGMAAIQLAKLFQCRVITTAGTEEKRQRALDLGADEVLDHYHADLLEEVRRLTCGRGVDVVIEHVGAVTWGSSHAALAHGGRLVTCGATTGYDVRIDLRNLYSKQQRLLGSSQGTLGDLHHVMPLVFSGQLFPVIDTVFPLADVRQAHARLERKEHFGKIVLAV